MLRSTINQLQSEADQLKKNVLKKEEMIKEKENLICKHLATIL